MPVASRRIDVRLAAYLRLKKGFFPGAGTPLLMSLAALFSVAFHPNLGRFLPRFSTAMGIAKRCVKEI